jgi:dipeptidyl aminopeptidase/acylaminoacyl peptidase
VTRLAYVAALAACAALAWQLARATNVFLVERRAYLPSPHPVPMPADAAEIGLRDISFPSRGGALLRGWYAPSRNRAAVILTHGSGADRRAVLADAHTLVRAGYGALLFDWPGQGESTGPVTWGRSERDALAGAIDAVARQPDVDPDRIGAIGFSDGGYITVQVAALDHRLRAVALEGTPSDLVEQTRAEYERGGLVPQLAASFALRVFGPDPREMRPIDVIRSIAPRAVLVVGGTADRTVPVAEARSLYAAAGEPKESLIVVGAGHGDYRRTQASPFDRALVDFFDRRLAPPR